MKRRSVLQAGLGAAAALVSPPAWAQTEDAAAFPSRLVTLIVPYPAGGVADARARLQADFLGRRFGQKVIVENIAGSAGIAAVRRTAAAKPDGYTLLSSTSSSMVVVPQLTNDGQFKPLQDLAVAAQVCVEPAMVLVPKASRFASFNDVVAEARRAPGTLTYASPGTNSLYHLCGEAIQHIADIRIRHVPYRGAAQYTVDLMAGRVDMAIGTLGTYVEFRDQLRGLLIAMPEPVAQAPDIPTAAQQGLSELNIPAGSGIFAPRDTPPGVLAKLQAACSEMVADPAARERVERLGLVPLYRAGEDFRKDMSAQYVSVHNLIVSVGLKPA